MGKGQSILAGTTYPGDAIQGFAPRSIQTVNTTLDTTKVTAIRAAVDYEYYINADSANKVTVLAGSITVIAESVESMEFTASTVVEVM